MKRRNKESKQKERLGEANKVMTHSESEKQEGFRENVLHGMVDDSSKVLLLLGVCKN